MASLGDIRESTIKEKDRIDADLQKMGEALQSLKSSVEKDEKILIQADFSSVLKNMVDDLSALAQTEDITILQQALQSQESLTAADLDRIIQHFISVKLAYTATKSLHLTDTSLQRYTQLVTHKSAMDDLLLKITTNPSTSSPEQDTQEQENTESSGVADSVPENIDPSVVSAQKNLIDGTTDTPPQLDQGNQTPTQEEKKSFWERAKESSFGLAYIFGAENMTTFKDWVSDKWDRFKEAIGWKKKEKKEDKKEDEKKNETTESPAASSETSTTSVDINTNLTEQERVLRNTYIKQSVLDTTTTPIPIDYKKDKDVLLQKGSPENIVFDAASQSIVLGGAIMKLKFPEFTMSVSGVDATVTNVDVRSIKVSGNNFVVEAKGTGKAGFIEQTKDISTTISKEKFYALLQPYLESGKMNYDTSLEFDGQKVPLKLDVSGAIEPVTESSGTESSENFVTYKAQIYNSYPEQERKYLDAISKNSADMYTQATTGLDKDRLPALLQEYDANLLSGLDGGTIAILGKQFSTVSDLIDDTALQRLGNMANNFLDTIINFISQGEDTPVIKWIAKMLKWPLEKLQLLIPNGNEQKQSNLRSAIEKQLQEDPSIKNDLEKVVKQFSLVRFYFTEKKAIVEEKGMDAEAFKKLSLSAAADLLQKNSLLDSSISKKMTVGLEANKVSVILQDLIQSKEPEFDLSDKRGKIVFNYKTNELESRSQKTKIEVSQDGKKYKIKDLGLVFSDLKSVLWLANLSNRMIQQTGGLSGLTANWSDHFAYNSDMSLTNWNRGGGLFIRDRGLIRTDTDKLVKDTTFEEYIKGRSVEQGKEYAAYLSKRLTVFGGTLFS